MPKSTDVPGELREFNRIFEKFEYRHECSEVWSDFLDLFIKQFSFDNCEKLNESVQKRYTQEERYVFGELIREAIQILDRQIRDDTDWYDIFGGFYEVIASNYKRQGFAQFFTPDSVTEIMTKCLGRNENLTGKGLLVGDPACGSGRNLINFHAKYPGNFLIGQDIDLVCCKMTIMNMVLHGCKGEVIWGDSLNPEDFREGWRITPYVMGIPQVYKIDKTESLSWRMWQEKKAKYLAKEATKQEAIKQVTAPKPVQLELNFI